MTIHLWILSDNFYIQHPLFFHPFINLFLFPSLIIAGILQNYCFPPTMSRLIQDRIQFFVLHALQKLIEGFNKIWHLRVQILTVMDDVIKPEMVQQPTKLATQNLVVVLSRKCPQHGTGVAEIISPPPVYELPKSSFCCR